MKKNSIKAKKPAVDSLYRLLSTCSISCLFRIAGVLAFVLAHTRNQMSTQARMNIQLCFPKLQKDQQQQLIRESLHHTCCAFFELAALWYRPIEQVLALINIDSLDDLFMHSTRAKIIIAPHHGSWELLNLWLANHGPVSSLYKPARSTTMDRFILAGRTRNGAHLVPVGTAGLRSLLKALKSNSSCMILPDQRPARNTAQIDAPFYSHQAATSLLIKKLANKVDCDIYIGAITRKLDSATYHLTIQALDRNLFIEDDLASASYLNTSIEQFIQKDLGQYQWPYRRFDRKLYSDAK